MELSARPPSPPGECQSDSPFLSGFPLPSGKGFNPFLTLKPPLEPRKGYSDYPGHTSGPSPNPGKRCTDSPHPLASTQFSSDPFSGLICSPGISSKTGTPSSLPKLIFSSPRQPPLRLVRCPFEPCSPLFRRQYCSESIRSGSPPRSPCFDRSKLIGSPPLHPQSPYCSLPSPPRTPRPCRPSPYIDQNSYLCCSAEYPSALVTSPVTYLPLTHRSPRTSPVTSPLLTHVRLETGPTISPPPAHRPMESRPVISPSLYYRAQISPLYPPCSSRRSYNDPPPPVAFSPPTGQFYQGCLKPPDSSQPKPQLDPPLVKNYCGSPLSSRANAPGCSSSPEEGLNYDSHLPPEAHMSAPGSPYCVICLSRGITGSSCSSQSQAPRKPCFESVFSWDTDGSSYLSSGATISGPPYSQETSPLSSHCPYSAFSFPSPMGNQFISSPQSPPCRSYNEPPLVIPVCPQEKCPKSPELKQPCAPHRCHSLVTIAQNTPDQPKPPEVSASSPPPSHPSGLSETKQEVTSTTTCSNSCPKKLPQGTALPTLVPRTLKTVISTSLPIRLPCDPVLPSIYAQSHPQGPTGGAPCSTHVYSVVPPTPDPFPLSGSTDPPQCHNQSMVPPCGTHGTPRGPPQPHCQPVGPPCSTHIYSFIPLRTPFHPSSLPIGPRPRGQSDTMPCGLHVYSVATQGSPKEIPQIPYSCPLPTSMSSSSSTNPSCSSTAIISQSQSNDSQNKNTLQSRSQSQNRCPHQSKSRSRSNSPQQSKSEDQCESLQCSKSQGQSKTVLHSRSQSRSKSPHHGKRQGKSKSSHHSGSQIKSLHLGKSHSRSKSPHHNHK
ncbi:sperm head and tail associated protein-like [Sturnira hondurensis]|uniref:sperm head and tail associated protein-like n=1 Tax=Sturnira hondurensis TaxID=192404 RepID=UPI0018799CB6|nr:sperm head and tail associated protein-like [Sturnira hondurensis]